jgi:hypothetical protein
MFIYGIKWKLWRTFSSDRYTKGLYLAQLEVLYN